MTVVTRLAISTLLATGSIFMGSAASAQITGTSSSQQTGTDVAEVPAASPFTITGSVSGISQYRLRGISLSDENFALQGSINVAHESGLYAGTWASSVAGYGSFGGGNVELDLYGGYAKTFGGATIDAGLIWYLYPSTSETDYAEVYASVSGTVGPATLKVGTYYAPDQSSIGSDDNLYVYGDANLGIPNTPLKLKAHVGRSMGDSSLTPAGDYWDWLVGADVSYKNLTLGVSYVDTNIGTARAGRFAFDHDIVDSAVLVSVSAAF